MGFFPVVHGSPTTASWGRTKRKKKPKQQQRLATATVVTYKSWKEEKRNKYTSGDGQ